MGLGNIGFGNTGTNSLRIRLTGDNQTGFGGLNSSAGSTGLFNSGTGNIGFFNTGTGNWGCSTRAATTPASVTAEQAVPGFQCREFQHESGRCR